MYVMLLSLVHKLKCETFNSFIHLIPPHLLFAVMLSWGPCLSVCLGPLNSNIHLCCQHLWSLRWWKRCNPCGKMQKLFRSYLRCNIVLDKKGMLVYR